MMRNVGGRKRRADHYARLFADTGLTPFGVVHRFFWTCSALHVRRRGPTNNGSI
ncbi:hypothetical protein ACFYPC_11020 [Streptomyces sp. NPDC005808]|uniref:hypothetical protein n=1 Tax=Streptomyces sp. NPDC005808 TaxID=3364734 RepID=UPI0036A39F42